MQIDIIETTGLGDRSYLVSDSGVGVVVDPQRDIDRVLALAGALERESEHPLAHAVVRYVDATDVPRLRATGFRNVTGIGALAEVDGHQVARG